MLIQFQIEYRTYFGQQMMITGSLPPLGNGKREQAAAMVYSENSIGIWRFQMETDTGTDFSYRYFISNDYDKTENDEWGENRQFNQNDPDCVSILLIDHWRTMSDPDYALITSAFTKAIFRQEKLLHHLKKGKTKTKNGIVLRFKPSVTRVISGHRIAVAGSPECMGAWNENRTLPLWNQNFPGWEGEVAVPVSEFPVKYKYLIQNEKNETLFWEKCNDRIIALPDGKLPGIIEIRDEKFDYQQIPWKGAGVAIPVFSLRRKEGHGIGEFTDLKLLTDWACEAGMQMIQILPVNDTIARHSWHDSYPYSAISVFALHPVYVNLFEIGRLKSVSATQMIDERGRFLNELDKIDYEAVMSLKSHYFKMIYDQQKSDFMMDPGFIAFFENNKYWLKPYAAFSFLRDLFDTPEFSHWKEYACFSPELLEGLTDPFSSRYDDITIHYFIQYHAHLQLHSSTEYARSKGVVLKGDLPIGISRNSVDAWINPGLYHMDCQAGAPPDDFSVNGQNWRFPTYNWDLMAIDNYAWWRQRLHHMSAYFDAFRIDHILGFFRIWEIPGSQVQGLLGYFNPSIPYSRPEILSKGIHFDENRFCQPYIREHFLTELFGEEKEYVKCNFLRKYAPGCFKMQSDFDTQSKVEEFLFPAEEINTEEMNRRVKIRDGLFSLIAEVIFIEKAGIHGKEYFPRNSFHSTRSYQELDPFTRQKLDEIYIDYFYRRNEDLWREKAMTKLPVLKSSTNMLLCGEDLGMVPACVPSVMNELGILSLEVQRMPKNPETEFGYPPDYPYLSVATPSSHDTSTIRGWWEENREKTQKYHNQILGNQGKAPDICTPDLVRQIIVQHLDSPSMWAVFPFQDLLGMDENLRFPDAQAERINEPGNPNHYWRYRMHMNLEDLPGQSELNQNLRKMIMDSGRYRVY